MAMTGSKDFDDIVENRLADANVSEDQQRRQLHRRYPVSSAKRDPNRAAAQGWQTLSSVAAEQNTILGRLHQKMAQKQSLEALLQKQILLPGNQRFQANFNAQGELIITVSNASAAHQLRYDLPTVKPAIEKALGKPVRAMKIQVDPNF